MKEKVIAIFDIGKTNKKLLLFDYNLRLIYEKETRFPEELDDDGFGCDNIGLIEKWLKDSVVSLIHSTSYDVTAINFTTYGATIVYLDSQGKRFTPVYNYLKPIDERIPEKIYKRYGGQDEFCRRTASPALGMLNSGMQILWFKSTRPALFSNVSQILHFPQFISYLFTGKIYSEHTSIGCHTALWDFDDMRYHSWLNDQSINLPLPVSVVTSDEIEIEGKKIKIGIGIHDSSASLAPYFTGNRGNFLLVSTGTWCINMNPFNSEKLTTEQLDNDCLCYMSVNMKPVKSSRLFLGNLHDTGVKMLSEHFKTSDEYYKEIRCDQDLIQILEQRYSGDKRVFLNSEPGSREFRDRIDLFEFMSYEEGYHQLMIELCELTHESIQLILAEKDEVENIYITGGFAKNDLFLKLIVQAFPSKKVFTSEIKNATALGAALVMFGSLEYKNPELNLGLTEIAV
jgi:sugar (pentulose or hexulose) kinase